MARNKYPEETRRLILETAAKLFIEQGYEQTSIQDIIDHLGGLSKGAIYHHFRSKEEMINEVANELYFPVQEQQIAIAGRQDLTGKEKLREMFRTSMYAPNQKQVFSAVPDLMENPKLLAVFMKESVQAEATDLVVRCLEEGIRDGSVKTKYPKELAEVMLLLGNVWINPMIYPDSAPEMAKKMRFFKELLDSLGLDIVEEEMVERLELYANIYHGSHSKKSTEAMPPKDK